MPGDTTSQAILHDAANDHPPSATQHINEVVTKRSEKGFVTCHLGFGQSDLPPPQQAIEAHARAVCSAEYPDIAGSERLRTAIARYETQRLGGALTIEPDQIVVSPGSKPVLFALFKLLPGDVLLPRPSWPPYAHQAAFGGKKITWVETEADRHDITESALETAVHEARTAGQDPKILLINSPNSPTGRVFQPDTVSTIASFCERNGIIVISDEIYAGILFPPWMQKMGGEEKIDVTSVATLYPHGSIITSGMSKLFSAGGWRIGYAVLPKTASGLALRAQIVAYASEIWSCAPAPASLAAISLYEAATEAISPSSAVITPSRSEAGEPIPLRLYLSTVKLLHAYAALRVWQSLNNVCKVPTPFPQGAFYLFPDFSSHRQHFVSKGVHTSEQLSVYLLETYGLSSVAGSACGDLPERLTLRLATSRLYFPPELLSAPQTVGGLARPHQDVVDLMQQAAEIQQSAESSVPPFSSQGDIEVATRDALLARLDCLEMAPLRAAVALLEGKLAKDLL